MRDCAVDGVSVVIPTWNRSSLLARLLSSLAAERDRVGVPFEVIVVDSSDGEERARIEHFCKEYGALFFAGEDSVRKKRNLGVDKTSYNLINFLDSDVEAEPNLVSSHIEAYEGRPFVGAVQGLTRFVGDGGFFWHVAEHSKLVSSFANAEKYPYQSWSITNNLSVKKSVFYEIGRFNENFPFKLGGDDLEMSYRIGVKGYMIASAPKAIALHSKETWDKSSALLDRTRRWGMMESLICELHPELNRLVVPPNWFFIAAVLFVFVVLACCLQSVCLLAVALAFLLIMFLDRYIRECVTRMKVVNPIVLICSLAVNARYERFRLWGHIKKGHHFPFMHGMVFNHHQLRGSMKDDASRLMRLLAITLMYLLLVVGALSYVL